MRNLAFALLQIWFTFCTITCFLFCSDEETVYSCNEFTNKWVKENIKLIHEMEKCNWDSLHDTLKIPAYRAFTPQQRINFWKDRFKEVKSLKWTHEEILHIEKAELFINNHLYLLSSNKLTDDQLDEVESFGYTWMLFGIEMFGWTPQIGNLIIGSGYTIDKKENKDNAPLLDCHCHADNIIFHNCGLYNIGCFKLKCNPANGGCGFFLMEDCDGLCD